MIEVTVEWIDAPIVPIIASSVFIRCRRQLEETTKTMGLYIELYQGQERWEIHVYEHHKPTVLDCSGTEYFNVLEQAFTTASSTLFHYKWSSEKGILTLMEQVTDSAFAMKYTSLVLTKTNGASHWHELLHDVVVQSQQRIEQSTRQTHRIEELEHMLTAKETLLEQALAAKQHVENALFTQFCTVLNTKKALIHRLQQQVETAERCRPDSNKQKQKLKQKKPIAVRKKSGAKLKKAKESEEEEEEEEEDPSEEDSDHSGHNQEEERNQKALKQEAIDAYSQLPINLSSQVTSADSVLSDLDAMMKTEVEADTNEEESPPMKPKRPSPIAAVTPSRPLDKKSKHSTTPMTNHNAIDSEEEDILEMLS